MSGTALEVKTPQQPRLHDAMTPRIAFLFGIALFSTVTLYMVQPFFIIYFTQTLGFSSPESGLLVALPFLAAILFGVVGGYVSDRVGVLRAYTLAMPIYGVSIGAIGFIHSFAAAAILLLASGIAMSVMSGGMQSIVNIEAQPEHRGLLQNHLYWLHNVGAILGLLVSSELLRAGHSNLPIILFGLVRLAMCMVIILIFSTKMTEPLQASHLSSASVRPGMLATLKFATTNPALLYTACSVLLITVMESQMDSTIPLYFSGHFSNGVALFGPIVALNAVVVVAFQPIAVKLFSRTKPIPVFTVGVMCTGTGLALGGIFGSLWAWIAGIILYSVGEGLWSIKLNDLMSHLPTPGNTALYFGSISTAQNLAFFIGLSCGSLVYHKFTPSVLFGSMILIALIVVVTFTFATKFSVQQSKAALSSRSLS